MTVPGEPRPFLTSADPQSMTALIHNCSRLLLIIHCLGCSYNQELGSWRSAALRLCSASYRSQTRFWLLTCSDVRPPVSILGERPGSMQSEQFWRRRKKNRERRWRLWGASTEANMQEQACSEHWINPTSFTMQIKQLIFKVESG